MSETGRPSEGTFRDIRQVPKRGICRRDYQPGAWGGLETTNPTLRAIVASAPADIPVAMVCVPHPSRAQYGQEDYEADMYFTGAEGEAPTCGSAEALVKRLGEWQGRRPIVLFVHYLNSHWETFLAVCPSSRRLIASCDACRACAGSVQCTDAPKGPKPRPAAKLTLLESSVVPAGGTVTLATEVRVAWRRDD